MYLGIDIGGTKTLAATLSATGEIVQSVRFPSNPDYELFLKELAEHLKELNLTEVDICCTAVPGLLNREQGVEIALGNLPWVNKYIRDDISSLLGGLPVIIENDARLAGLSEARLIQDQYKTILFLTVSTGIGGALIRDGSLVEALLDTEMGKSPFMFEGAITHWEDFAGGRAIVKRFGKRASEIDDPESWDIIGKNIGYGLAVICSILQPDAVIFGGGVGTFADKFTPATKKYLEQYLHAVVKEPQALLAAQRADDAVIYGCYELARQSHEATT